MMPVSYSLTAKKDTAADRLEQTIELTLLIKLDHIGVATDVKITDKNLWNGHLTSTFAQHILLSTFNLIDANLAVSYILGIQHLFSPGAIGAKTTAVDNNFRHIDLLFAFFRNGQMSIFPGHDAASKVIHLLKTPARQFTTDAS
jgi:hypothetical protein